MSNINECIFCKIVNEEAKSWTVYEDKDVKAFFGINPASKGHTIIIPKKHYENIIDIPENELKKIIVVIKKLAKMYEKKLGLKEFNIMHASGINAQQSVFHFHMHLVPREKEDGLDLWFKVKKEVVKDFDNLLKKIKLEEVK